MSIQFDLFCTSFCIETCLQSCPRQTMQTNKCFVFAFSTTTHKGEVGWEGFWEGDLRDVFWRLRLWVLCFLFSFVELSNWVLRRAWVINLRFDLEAIAWGLLAESFPARNRYVK